MPHVGLRSGPDEPERPVYETLKAQLVSRRARARREGAACTSCAADARRLPEPRPPRSHPARRRGPAHGQVPARLLRQPVTEAAIAEGYDVRLALELQAADTAVGRLGGGALGRFPRAPRGHRRGRLAHGVGLRQRRLPRAPGRPRRQRPALALLPRALGQPDDAGDPRRQARGRLEPADRARRDRRRVRGRRPRGRAGCDQSRTSPPAAGSRSRRSRAPAACSSAAGRSIRPWATAGD